MSKASEWAKQSKVMRWREDIWGVYVDPKGRLMIAGHLNLSPDEALALGRWIVEIFGEKVQSDTMDLL